LMAGHFWHGLRARAKAAGFVFSAMKFGGAALGETQFASIASEGGIVQPALGNPLIGNLATPINNSMVSMNWVKNLPIYREKTSANVRGLEIGMAHGYLLLGPFLKLGPLRDTANALLSGVASASGLVVILTICLWIYGAVVFQGREKPAGELPVNMQGGKDWRSFSYGFLIGGLGGVVFAAFLLREIGRAALNI
jgi:photosystem II CP43 chlorophyll apoprotein